MCFDWDSSFSLARIHSRASSVWHVACGDVVVKVAIDTDAVRHISSQIRIGVDRVFLLRHISLGLPSLMRMQFGIEARTHL